MPPLSRWLVKSGFVALVLGLLTQLLLLRPVTLWPRLPDAALHLGGIHLLTVGWLLQVMVGVGFWMFPRHPTRPPRGDERPGWVGFGLLNGGLALRLVGESWYLGFGGPRWTLVLSGVLQLGAVLLFVGLLWPRVRTTAS